MGFYTAIWSVQRYDTPPVCYGMLGIQVKSPDGPPLPSLLERLRIQLFRLALLCLKRPGDYQARDSSKGEAVPAAFGGHSLI